MVVVVVVAFEPYIKRCGSLHQWKRMREFERLIKHGRRLNSIHLVTMAVRINKSGAIQHQLGLRRGTFWALKAPFWASLHLLVGKTWLASSRHCASIQTQVM